MKKKHACLQNHMIKNPFLHLPGIPFVRVARPFLRCPSPGLGMSAAAALSVCLSVALVGAAAVSVCLSVALVDASPVFLRERDTVRLPFAETHLEK